MAVVLFRAVYWSFRILPYSKLSVDCFFATINTSDQLFLILKNVNI